jgi:hypothetical protein
MVICDRERLPAGAVTRLSISLVIHQIPSS